MSDRIEIYRNGEDRPFVVGWSSFQPNDDDLINIRKVTYKVLGRSFTVDRSNELDQQIRCNIIVEEVR